MPGCRPPQDRESPATWDGTRLPMTLRPAMISYTIATQHPAVYIFGAALFFFLGFMVGLYGYAQADRIGYKRALSMIARQDAERGV